MLGAPNHHRESVLGAGALQQVPTCLVQPLTPRPVPPGFLDSQSLSPPVTQPRGPRRALRVAGERRAICFHQMLFLLPLTTPLAPLPKSGFRLEPPHLCENQPLSPSSRCLPLSLNFSFFFFFFLPGTGNCETARESPGGFSSKRSPAVLRRAQRTGLNVTLSPSSAPAGRPGPSGSPGGHRALADSPMAGRATMFSVHSEIKSTTLDPSNLLCG